jgi:predicted transposase YdaD
MAATDDPLKVLVESCIEDFAAWLLNAEVLETHALNSELPGQPRRVDQLYRVKLVSQRLVKLHIEFQGPSSHEPVPLRMLDYMSRHILADPDLDLQSVVIYVGQGAGIGDSGRHEIRGADGLPVFTWRYQVVRLWQMQANELLALNRPALLPLVGQTAIDDPATVLSQVVERLSTVANTSLRQRLLSSLVAWTDD